MGRRRKLWWATWPGALGFGAASLLLVLPALFAAVVFVSLSGDDSAGLDFQVEGPGAVSRILAVLLFIGAATLPVLTARWARKRWAGYLLLGVGLSAVAFIVGLIMLGVL